MIADQCDSPYHRPDLTAAKPRRTLWAVSGPWRYSNEIPRCCDFERSPPLFYLAVLRAPPACPMFIRGLRGASGKTQRLRLGACRGNVSANHRVLCGNRFPAEISPRRTRRFAEGGPSDLQEAPRNAKSRQQYRGSCDGIGARCEVVSRRSVGSPAVREGLDLRLSRRLTVPLPARPS